MIFVILGASCSGKTQLAAEFVKQGCSRVITNTTRPRRVDDKSDSYHFRSTEEFESKIANNEMVEYVTYNGFYYGVSLDSLSDNCVVVLEPKGYEVLKKLYPTKVYGIYLKVSAGERLRRGWLRGDNLNTLQTRILEDEKLFDIAFEQGVNCILNCPSKADYVHIAKMCKG